MKYIWLTTCLSCLSMQAVSQEQMHASWLPLSDFFGVEQEEAPAKAPYETSPTQPAQPAPSTVEDFLQNAPDEATFPQFPHRAQASARLLPQTSPAAQLEDFLNQKNWYRAVPTARQLLQTPLTARERAYVWYGLSIAYAQQNQFNEAWRALQPALEQGVYFSQDVQMWAKTLLLHRAELALLHNKTNQAAQFLSQARAFAGNTNTRLRTQRLQRKLNNDTVTREGYLRVGALLPLSGPHARLGDALLKTIQMAVFAKDDLNIVVYPVDAGATAESAYSAAKQLKDLEVEAVIGPLLSSQVEAVAPVFNPQQVPVLPFSSDPHVAATGVHLLGFRADQQARHMAAHAAATSRTNVAALVPATPYGYEAFNTFQQQADELALNLRAPVFFNPEKADLRTELEKILPKPADELEVTVADGITQTVPPEKPFDALFLPISGQMLPLLSSQMAVYDVDRMDVMLLGTTDWAQLVQGDPYVPLAHFPAVAASSFAADYQAHYQTTPPALATLAADALYALAAAAQDNMPLSNALLRPSGFAVPGGAVRFHPQGRTERAFALRAVKHSRLDDVQPAPLLLPPLVPGKY